MVYILLADGFEEAEAIVPWDILRRGGVEVTLVGLDKREVTGSHGLKVTAEYSLAEIRPKGIKMLVLPGGGGYVRIRDDSRAVTLIERCSQEGAYVAAICAAPTILGGLGLLDRRKAVCYPGMEDGLGSAVVCKGSQVVTDGRFVTGEGPGSAYEFGYRLLELLKGEEMLKLVKEEMHFHH